MPKFKRGHDGSLIGFRENEIEIQTARIFRAALPSLKIVLQDLQRQKRCFFCDDSLEYPHEKTCPVNMLQKAVDLYETTWKEE